MIKQAVRNVLWLLLGVASGIVLFYYGFFYGISNPPVVAQTKFERIEKENGFYVLRLRYEMNWMGKTIPNSLREIQIFFSTPVELNDFLNSAKERND